VVKAAKQVRLLSIDDDVYKTTFICFLLFSFDACIYAVMINHTRLVLCVKRNRGRATQISDGDFEVKRR
jgi:hypothetical protein